LCSFRPEAQLADFDIQSIVNIEILKIEPIERRVNLLNEALVVPDDLRLIELHVLWKGRRVIYSMTQPYYTNNLTDGIFEFSFMGTVNAFRGLFDQNLEMVGRGIGEASAPGGGEINSFDWNKLESIIVNLLPEGPNENEFWSRAGGDKSMLKLNQNGRASWHIALGLLAKGASGISPDKFVTRLRLEFPNNKELIDVLDSNKKLT
jgi:hypothetical protein